MVADAEALEQQSPPEAVLETDAAGFRGSFSGYERDRLFYNPNGASDRFVQSAYVFGLDDDHDGRTAVPVDIDGDGDLDLVLLTLRGLKLYENTSPPRSFSRIELIGAHATDGVLGAVVSLTADGVTRRDFVKVTEGFRGQVPSELHFGLDAATSVERIEVRWPSGDTDVWQNLPVDRHLRIRAGKKDVEVRPLDRWPEGTRPVLTGRPSVSVVAERLDGRSTPVGGSRPTVINFWAPWCAPCNVELPQLVSLSRRYDGLVDFVGMSVERDDLASVRASIDQFEIGYPQFLADDKVMEQFFGDGAEAALPSTFVFDGAGTLRRVFRGAITGPDLDTLLGSFREEGDSEPKLRLLAETYFASGDYDKAIDFYTRLTELKPGQGQIGMAWERQRRADRASLAAAWVGKARGHQGRGDMDTARGSYERALEIEPRNGPAEEGLRELR